MKQFLKAALLGVALSTSVHGAHAATYALSFKQLGSLQVVDLLVTTAVAADAFQAVTSLSGIVNNQTIVGLSAYSGADNLFKTANPYLSSNGIGFVDSLGTLWNLKSDTNQTFFLASNKGGTDNATLSLETAPTAVPEPDGAALMIGGLGVLGMVARRQRGERARGSSAR